MAEQSEQWLVVKRDLYWRPGDLGYTGIRDNAARYSYEEAKARVGDGLSGVSMVRASEAPEIRAACYSDLAIAHLSRHRDMLRSGLQIIAEAGAVHGAGWCVAQARGYLENLDFDQFPENGKAT